VLRARTVVILLLVLVLAACGNVSSGPVCPAGQHVETETSVEWTYHWGYNLLSGKYEYHFGPQTTTERWCALD
jgi:ABC-type glycerol-3-phosphate transport system substrate-binding protein